MIPLLIFCWSLVLIGTGFMKTVGQLYASRLLLGLFESGLFPCLALYLSSWYQPREQALRISYLFVSAALSGSIGTQAANANEPVGRQAMKHSHMRKRWCLDQSGNWIVTLRVKLHLFISALRLSVVDGYPFVQSLQSDTFWPCGARWA